MIIKNNTNGKRVSLSKAKWDALGKQQKAGFTVESESESLVTDQVVENKIVRKPVEEKPEIVKKKDKKK